jgi:hypothetical protein
MKQNLQTYNRILKRSIREAKAKYYYTKFEKSKNDSKKTWSTINEVLNKSTANNTIEYIHHNNTKIEDKKHIANCFNAYFSNIGTNMASKIEINKDYNYTDFLKSKRHHLNFTP